MGGREIVLTEKNIVKRAAKKTLCITLTAVLFAAGAVSAGAADVTIDYGDTTLTFDRNSPVLANGDDAKILREQDPFADARFPDESLGSAPPLYVLNRTFLFEPVEISDEAARDYADIVNSFAREVPEVNVYSMLMPDIYEVYAPTKYSTDQLRSIEYIYKQLEGVQPIDVVSALAEHAADEKLYFYTDHHWTQRGAYYAWKAFMDMKGMEVPPLSEFREVNTYFTGSLGNLLSDEQKTLLDSTTEQFERFSPIYNTHAGVFRDAAMTSYICDIEVLDLGYNSYMSFIKGDNALTVIDSDVGNGKSIAIIKESFGNPIAVWAVNNYEKIYVIDIRGFKDGSFNIRDFYEMTHFDDLLIESYPATIAHDDLRGFIKTLL